MDGGHFCALNLLVGCIECIREIPVCLAFRLQPPLTRINYAQIDFAPNLLVKALLQACQKKSF